MKILVTGGSGLLGKALSRVADASSSDHELTLLSSADADLRQRAQCGELFSENYDAVIHAAARVGGIAANVEDPVGFLVDNLAINQNVIDAAFRAGIGKLIFMGSSCMYPKDYRQPLIEEDILAAPLEETNEGYALSKITAARHCEYLSRQYGLEYRTLVPCNLFGLDDHFTSQASHLIAAAVNKVVAAKREGADSVEIWGDGTARREFLFADDLAAFMLDVLHRLDRLPPVLNVGYGEDFSVDEYYEMVMRATGVELDMKHDTTKPAGMAFKLMSSGKAEALGWRPATQIEDAIKRVVDGFEAES